MTDLTIQDLFDKLPVAFLPERAVGVNTTIFFELEGERGGEWLVHIHDQRCQVSRARLETPNLLVRANAQDVLDIFTGKMDAVRAYMQGKVQMIGDMSLAMRLTSLFDVRKV
jgi:putative sterol carrier protein